MNSLRFTLLIGFALASCVSEPRNYENRLASWDQLQEDREAAAAQDFEELVGVDEGSDELTQLLRYARANNPGLEAAFQRWKQALEQVPQVSALPNPRLSFGAYLSSVETRVGPMDARVGIVQPFPWFGKLDLAGDVAFEVSEVSRELLEAMRLELDKRIRDAWFEYAWVEEAIVITRGNEDLLLHWESVARARLETGLGGHADVIRAQVELGKLADRIRTLEDYRRPLIAKLNAALNRPASAALPTPAYPLPEPPHIDEERLVARLSETSPVLRSLGHRIVAAEHGIELADKDFYPNFFIGADYTFIGSAATPGTPGSGDDAVALVLGLDLPIWRSAYAAGSRAAEAETKSARKEQVETMNRLSAELEMSLYQFRDANRRVELYRDSLVPKGEESVQALDIAYQSGDEGFLDLIDAQRVLLEFQLQTARAAADRAKALAETERITGIQLNPER